jgi:hypothetical protein
MITYFCGRSLGWRWSSPKEYVQHRQARPSSSSSRSTIDLVYQIRDRVSPLTTSRNKIWDQTPCKSISWINVIESCNTPKSRQVWIWFLAIRLLVSWRGYTQLDLAAWSRLSSTGCTVGSSGRFPKGVASCNWEAQLYFKENHAAMVCDLKSPLSVALKTYYVYFYWKESSISFHFFSSVVRVSTSA